MRARRHRGNVRAHNARYGPLVVLATEDPALQRLLGNLLAAQGYRAVVSGASSEEVVARIQPMLVLLDSIGRTGKALQS